MPNPKASYHILPSSVDSSFKILEMTRYGDVVRTFGSFNWIRSDAITDGKNIYKMNCNADL